MKVKISFLGVMMLVSLIVTHSYLSLAALLAAFAHEMGHLLSASLCELPVKELRLDIFGAAITPEKSFCSYKKEIAVALGGPLVNLLFGIFILLFVKGGEFLTMFMTASFFLGALNLLPIHDFDGGRVLSCALCFAFSPRSAERICSVISFVILLALWMTSVYMMLQFGASLSLFVFSFALLCKMFVSKKI